jgi:hypothetical protein
MGRLLLSVQIGLGLLIAAIRALDVAPAQPGAPVRRRHPVHGAFSISFSLVQLTVPDALRRPRA